ncbi:hypothetical protein 056SW001B_83 [Bacillus phage 056SW001B]|uniref:Uncharacterized protein n=1 Tax=Bacillus phage 056SW001B TaxID=2601663 RepID=A0A5P8PIJ5_9CAUD|nr:hypothetical protein 056SW001B_83 [Bacillus phage 056SW001B]
MHLKVPEKATEKFIEEVKLIGSQGFEKAEEDN